MTSPPSNSDAQSSAYEALHPRIRRWIHEQGWRRLHEAQEHAATPILAGDQDVIITAATAAGKTEAAWLPICTALLRDAEQGRGRAGVKALYVAPLKALINDQHDRLSRLCEPLDLPVHRWHGDVPGSRKAALRRAPDGLLLITPESLEALFVTSGTKVGAVLGGLRYVVVDEFHAFIGTERGAQLQSLLHRVELLVRRTLPRIALSATLGDFTAAAGFLRPGRGDAVQVIHGADDGRELKLLLRGHVATDPGRPRTDDEEPRDKAAIADHLFRTLRGTDNLVFARSRSDVEEYADLLGRRAAEHAIPNTFLPHHGNLAKELREHVEARLKDPATPVSAICTSTLEMGIDIGSVHSVAQVGTPPTVASLRQRLGRSGRRDGEAAVLRLYVSEPELTARTPPADVLRTELVQTAAMVELLLEQWYEPPDVAALHLSTLVQQMLSVIAQRSGARADALHSVLCGHGPFARVDRRTFLALLRAMHAADLISQAADGLLLTGVAGERLVNHYSFYTAFHTAEEYRLVTGGRTLGTLPVDFPVAAGTLLIFGGRRWQVLDVHPQEKVIDLARSSGGRAPAFTGGGAEVSDEVRRRMVRIYCGDDVPIYLDRVAQELLGEGRAAFARMRLAESPIVGWGKETLLFPFRGDRIVNTLAVVLAGHGLEVGQDGAALTVRGTNPFGLWHLLRELGAGPEPDPVELAAGVAIKEADKHDRYLTDELLSLGYAARSLDVRGAWDALARLADTPAPRCDAGAVPVVVSRQAELGRTPFAVVDVATTGIAPHRDDRIVEIAVVRTGPDGTVESEWTTVLDPERDPGPTHVHGLTGGDVAGAPRFAEVADRLLAQLDGAVVVAHNARFDLGFLVAELELAGYQLPLWPALCTLELAELVGAEPSRRIADCCAAEGIDVGDRREALGDAIAAARLLAIYLTRARTHRMSLADLGCHPLDLPHPRARRSAAGPPLRPRPHSPDVAQETAARRQAHALGPAGLVARTRAARTGDTRGDAYLDVLDRVLADGVLTDDDLATVREVAQTWGLSAARIDELHACFLDELGPADRDVLAARLGKNGRS
nr:DEAD/DEAH box helicase [Pseudonocardia sp.]